MASQAILSKLEKPLRFKGKQDRQKFYLFLLGVVLIAAVLITWLDHHSRATKRTLEASTASTQKQGEAGKRYVVVPLLVWNISVEVSRSSTIDPRAVRFHEEVVQRLREAEKKWSYSQTEGQGRIVKSGEINWHKCWAWVEFSDGKASSVPGCGEGKYHPENPILSERLYTPEDVANFILAYIQALTPTRI